MTPCKFQTSADGESLLVYSEDRTTVHMQTSDRKIIRDVCATLLLPRRMGRVFAMAETSPKNEIIIGDALPNMVW